MTLWGYSMGTLNVILNAKILEHEKSCLGGGWVGGWQIKKVVLLQSQALKIKQVTDKSPLKSPLGSPSKSLLNTLLKTS